MVQSASSYLTLPSRDTLRKRQTPVSKSNFKQSDIHKEVLNIKKKFDCSLAQFKDNFYTPIHWGVFEKIKFNQLPFFEEQYFRSLADEGDPIAAYMYGTMKFLGVGVQKNEEEGYGYLLLAKQSGSKLATIALKSYKEAFAKFSTGAELCPISQQPIQRPLMTDCSHMFEEESLMQWYQNQRKEEQPFSCPCCRKKIDHLFDARTGSIFSKVRWSSYGLGNKY